VRAVHGVEVLAELEPAMALLREGIVPAAVYFRLKDTARALAGELESGPDLAAHLLALEPSVRRGMSIAEFAEWLRQKAALLQDGVVDPELMTWFDEVRPALREIEAEICAGLRGVVDFGYVKAQARAAVAHVDAQVGALVARLREEGAYDDATIAFMSGHGELFGEHGEYGHHQTPLEAVVHIPLVIKPARGAGIRPRHVQGPFELIDLLPTLADLLALPAVDVDGTSRAADIRDGLVIAEHDTVTLDAHGVTVVLRRGAHKLTLTRGWTSVGGEAVRPGTTRLFRVEGTVETPVDDPDMTSAMRATVEEWLTDARLPAVPT
jgi:hypothetical protein